MKMAASPSRAPLRLLFFGTPSFAAEILDYLLQHQMEIVAIVTQPDRPQGRSLQCTASDVKQKAILLAPHLPILQPEKVGDPHCVEELALFRADLFVVVAFGQILSQSVLDLPRLGCINVHASLLPLYRGAAPMQRALMDGVSATGVTIMKMVRKMDAGDRIAQAEIPISHECTFGQLKEELCRISQPLLLSVLHAYAEGIPVAVPQDTARVTYAPKIGPEESKIDWQRSAQEIHHLIRALSPEPGAWCWLVHKGEKKRMKIFLSRTTSLTANNEPGAFVLCEGEGIFVQCKEGLIQLLEVQMDGKKKILFSEWIRGMQTPFSALSLL